jgi:hypothetical protein
MAGANSNIQITDLDFDTIKNNLKTFLKSQDTLKDYNYEGSALSTLLDVLAYNTQYQAYYTNMVANEMFLDTAIQRSSVVSLAKSLGYTPKSVIAPSATVNITVNNVATNTPTLVLPKYTKFMSENIDGTNYTFVTSDTTTAEADFNTHSATFYNIKLKQGVPGSLSLVVNNSVNPTSKIKIPDLNVDTTTLQVLVQQSNINSTYETFSLAEDYLTMNGSSTSYFLQEGIDGYYEIYFGDGILGKQLTDGNIVTVTYISSNGDASHGANNFVALDSINGYASMLITTVSPASQGSQKESTDSIRFHAPKAFSAQNRAVSKQDYINAIQNNNLGYSFDAVNVWGGEENDPPVYGQVMVSIKPSGAYNLTQIQKERLAADVIRPISVMTVVPTFVDPDYVYLQMTANVWYDPKKTNLTANQIQTSIKAAISAYAQTSLNGFNSIFSMSDFNAIIRGVNKSIITNEIDLKLQKKLYPNLSTPTTYNLQFGVPLEKGMFQSGVNSNPSLTYRDPLNFSNTIGSVFIEEVPSTTGGVESVSVTNPGYSYTTAPTVTIKGDGSGAAAYAVLSGSGTIREIVLTEAGSGYTSAIAVITPADGDTTGRGGDAFVNLQGRYGTLRTYYNNTTNVKTILNENVGTVDYETGIVTLNSFSPVGIDDPLGQLTITAKPRTSLLSSTYNRIITVDPYDGLAIIVNVYAKA